MYRPVCLQTGDYCARQECAGGDKQCDTDRQMVVVLRHRRGSVAWQHCGLTPEQIETFRAEYAALKLDPNDSTEVLKFVQTKLGQQESAE